MTQLDKIQNGDLALIIDCGTGDFFLEVNQKFHEELENEVFSTILSSVPENIAAPIGIIQ